MTQTLAERIKKLMELDVKRTQGKWSWVERKKGFSVVLARLVSSHNPSDDVCNFGNNEQYYPTEGTEPSFEDKNFIAAAPEAVAIIRELVTIIQAQHESLREAVQSHDNLYMAHFNNQDGCDHDLAIIPARLALALSAPLVGLKVGE